MFVGFPVDGKYTHWSSWSTCSRTCAGGNQRRSRSCANPPPANGGRDCRGPAEKTRGCNTQNCPGKYYLLLFTLVTNAFHGTFPSQSWLKTHLGCASLLFFKLPSSQCSGFYWMKHSYLHLSTANNHIWFCSQACENSSNPLRVEYEQTKKFSGVQLVWQPGVGISEEKRSETQDSNREQDTKFSLSNI